ncbi:unnamed protein product [Thlaspi arvense]|uniref:Uncharacterized protein n=1 Tax=Thlaspi arvense TaxID=13288 RepID=A0AAU9RK86_THLAR|nr:unnamed protein product [Thlaspi arvense]
MAVKVIKNYRVSPAIDSYHDSVDPLVLPLTFFDLQWVRSHPTDQVFFYKLSESSREFFHSVILPKLDLSLSLVLRHYLPFAGSLKWDPQDPKPRIFVFGHDTVSLTVAESDAEFSLISGKGLRPQSELRVLDLTPTLDRTLIEVPPGLESKILESMSYFSDDKDGKRTMKPPPTAETRTDLVRITLELTRENVEKLRKQAKRESTCSQLELRDLSTFVVLNAYVWSCLVKARGGNEERPVLFMYAADFRNRLDPPVPERYLGNCVFLITCTGYKANTLLGRDGFVNVVEIISDSVKGLSSRGIEALCESYIDAMY